MGSYSKELGDYLDVIFYVLFLTVNWVFIGYIFLLIMDLIIFKVINNTKGPSKMLKFLRFLVHNLRCFRFAHLLNK